MYPEAYGADCNSSSNKPYGLPNFGGLTADRSLPQRCQDPSLIKVPLHTTATSSIACNTAEPCNYHAVHVSHMHICHSDTCVHEEKMHCQCHRG